jgi:hypothetical protein
MKLPNYKAQASLFTLLEVYNSENLSNPTQIIENKTALLEYLTQSTIDKVNKFIADEFPSGVFINPYLYEDPDFKTRNFARAYNSENIGLMLDDKLEFRNVGDDLSFMPRLAFDFDKIQDNLGELLQTKELSTKMKTFANDFISILSESKQRNLYPTEIDEKSINQIKASMRLKGFTNQDISDAIVNLVHNSYLYDTNLDSYIKQYINKIKEC